MWRHRLAFCHTLDKAFEVCGLVDCVPSTSHAGRERALVSGETGFVLLLGLLLSGFGLPSVSSPSHHTCATADRRADGRAFSRIACDGAADRAQRGASGCPSDHLPLRLGEAACSTVCVGSNPVCSLPHL